MEAIQIYKVGFDSLENSLGNAIYEELLGTFIEKGSNTALGNANEYLRTIQLDSPQIAWDGNVYPFIKYKKISIS